MCTLYSNTKARELIRALFRVSDNRAAAFEPRNAILPSETAPVVRLAEDGERELVNLSWGFVRLEQGKAPRRVVNTRDDQIRTNPFWRSSFETRRCLVPATSYSEPQGTKPATWHWFAINPRPDRSSVYQRDRESAAENNAEDPRPLFAFPGIWRRYKGPLKKDGPTVEIDVYSIMTTTPNALTASINHERMPVLLTSDADFGTWMHGSPAEAFALARPYPVEGMQHVGSGLERRDANATQAGDPQRTLLL